MEAMIFAAGLGTRLQTETANKPKALVDVGGKPLLQHAIDKLKIAGVTKIVVNVHHFAKQVIAFIDQQKQDIPILISDESEQLLDTGGGLKKAAPLFSGKAPILIYNVDILSSINLKELNHTHLDSGALATLVVRKRETQRYFQFNNEMQLTGWINKATGANKISRASNLPNITELAFSGIHIVQPEIFQDMPREERFSIVRFYLEQAKTKTIKGYLDESKLWMDVGKPEQLALARKMIRNKKQ